MTTSLPPILGVSEVTELLGASQVHVLRLANSGALRGRKLGDGLRSPWAFLAEDVQAYLDAHAEKSA